MPCEKDGEVPGMVNPASEDTPLDGVTDQMRLVSIISFSVLMCGASLT